MIALLASLLYHPLLAQRDAWESLGNRFSGKHAKFTTGDLTSLIAVLVAGGVLVWLLNWVYRRQQARRLSCEPRHLFADLCRAHRLGRADRKRLRVLAEHHDLASPALLFMRLDLFEPECLPEGDSALPAHYQRLKGRLFAGLEGPADRSSASAAPEVGGRRAAVVPVGMPPAVDSATSNV